MWEMSEESLAGSFKSYAAERTSEIRATIHKEMCTTNNRISSLLGKVDWSAVKG
ncbi:MAG: hypothetical protein ACLUVD_06080 [Mediterraneibacter faecis]